MKQVSKSRKCSCGGMMKETLVSRTIPLAGRDVNVQKIKGSVCEKCGEVYLDGPSILKLETSLLKQSTLQKA